MTTQTAPLVFLDTETTSLRHDRLPWEIAMIRREPDGTETEYLAQVRHVDLSNADVDALKIGRFYDRYKGDTDQYEIQAFKRELTARAWLPGDPTPLRLLTEAAAARHVEHVTRDAVIIGVNPAFDTATLAPMLARHGLTPTWHYSPIDLKAMAAGWIRHRPDLWPLTTAIADLNIDLIKEQHRLGKLAVPAVTQRRVTEAKVRDLRSTIDAWQRTQDAFLAPPYHSYDLSKACGVNPPTEDEAHTALGDAHWVRRWYDALTGKAA